MNRLFTRPRVYLVLGLVLMIVGAIDPLEGSVVIAAGIVVATFGAFLAHDRRRVTMTGACAMVLAGVALLFALSALGGVGGDSGRSIWWLLILLPYPAGWVMGLVLLVQILRRRSEAPAH